MADKYAGYRHPKEVIKYAVWLYYRLNASLRDTVESLFYRGFDVSHETVRQWVYKFGSLFSSLIKKVQPKRGDKQTLIPALSRKLPRKLRFLRSKLT